MWQHARAHYVIQALYMKRGTWFWILFCVVNIRRLGQCKFCVLGKLDSLILLLEEKLGGCFFSSWSPSCLTYVDKTIVGQVVFWVEWQTALITACCWYRWHFVTQWHISYCLEVHSHDWYILWTFVIYGSLPQRAKGALVQILVTCPLQVN
jgi:hypothetical protein